MFQFSSPGELNERRERTVSAVFFSQNPKHLKGKVSKYSVDPAQADHNESKQFKNGHGLCETGNIPWGSCFALNIVA